MDLSSVALIWWDICILVSCVPCILKWFVLCFYSSLECLSIILFPIYLMFCCMATEQLRFSKKYPWSFSILTNFLDLKYCLHHLDNLHVFKSEWIQYCRRWDGGLPVHTDSLIQTKCKVFSSLLFSTTVQDSLVAVLHLLCSEMIKTNTPKKCSLRPHKINI